MKKYTGHNMQSVSSNLSRNSKENMKQLARFEKEKGKKSLVIHPASTLSQKSRNKECYGHLRTAKDDTRF